MFCVRNLICIGYTIEKGENIMYLLTYSIYAWFQLKFSFGSKHQRRFEVNRNEKKTGFLHKYSKILSNQEEEEPLIFEKTRNMAEENNGPTILVTGGAGYIGTHCIIELLQKDYNVVAIDNFTNSVKGENGKK